MNVRKSAVRFSAIVGAVLIIAVAVVVYIIQLNSVVTGNIMGTISELAEHDQNIIQRYIEMTWADLEYLEGRLGSYHCGTVKEMEEQLNIERANSIFSHLYIVAEDGKIYSDDYVAYDPESGGVSEKMKPLAYFENGEERVVARFDDEFAAEGICGEHLLYGIRLEDLSVEGIRMAALVGVSDIKDIQNNMVINSFYKDGVSRGYSAVIDMNGDYIVNVGGTVVSSEADSFFYRIQTSRKCELNSDDIAELMAAGETFTFYFTNQSGVDRVVYMKPFGSEKIDWYFLMSVEKSVFTEQNQMFLTMSMVMLAIVVLVVALVLLFVLISQSRVEVAKADAKARSEFLANMSHEIRTPLNGVVGLIHLMEKDVGEEGGDARKKMQDRLAKARSTANYLLSLVNDILDMSKIQAGKVDLNYEAASLDIILDAIWSMQKDNIESRGVKFTIEKEITVPWIVIDETRLKQVLINIVGNAAKFTSEGRITLSVTQVRRDEGHVSTTFICTDTGCGMTEEFQKQIWNSFSQERSKSGNGPKGTGLGMAISKLVVDAMGGSIKVESKLDAGSTFTVTIPSEIAKEPEYLLRKEKEATNAEQCRRPIKVLVAEDNELNAELLLEILKSEGFTAERVENGKIALEKFRASRVGEFDVILMDMQLPVMDGCTAASEIRRLDRPDAGTVAIFACTANTFKEDRDRAAASGMNDFLSKPVDVKALIRKLSGIRAETQEQNVDKEM